MNRAKAMIAGLKRRLARFVGLAHGVSAQTRHSTPTISALARESRFFATLRKDTQYWEHEWSEGARSFSYDLRQDTQMRRKPPTHAKKELRYIWGGIVRDENHGNYLIECCLKNLLELPKPSLVVDVRNAEFPDDLNRYAFVVNPGTTTLYQEPAIDMAYERLGEHRTPIVSFGGAVWYRDKWSKACREEAFLSVARKMGYPVGCRDPFTYDLLRANDIAAVFVGCPTLFPLDTPVAGDYVAFSFGRNDLPRQMALAKLLMRSHRVKVLAHDKNEATFCRKMGIEPITNPSVFLSTYYAARCVVTGRVHGALPGISVAKPVFYFSSVPVFDSRTTLLSYLRLPLRRLDEIPGLDLSRIEYDGERVTALKSNFMAYVKRFREEFAL